MTCATIISIATDIIVAIAAISTVYIAWSGLSSWKKQIKGATAHECALRIFTAIGNYEKYSLLFRHPLIGTTLIASPKALARAAKENPEKIKETLVDRHQELHKAINEVYSEVELVRAIWDNETAEKIMNIVLMYDKLLTQFTTWLSCAESGEECKEDLSAVIMPAKAIKGKEKDEYQENLTSALNEVREFFAKKISVSS